VLVQNEQTCCWLAIHQRVRQQAGVCLFNSTARIDPEF
jgi:hypothetical protein